MSEFVAGAFVDVKPDAKNFRAELKRQVNTQIKDPIPIPVTLDPKRFKSTVNAAAKGTTAKVPIVISTSVADLRTQIQNKINSATKGLKIRVPIEVEQTGAGARGGQARGGGGGTARRTASSAVSSTKALTAAEKQQEAVNKALKKSEEQLAISSKAFEDSKRQNITSEEQLLRLRESRTASTRAAKAANNLLATSADDLTATQKAALQTASEEAVKTREAVSEKIKDASATAFASGLQDKATKSRAKATEIVAVEVKEIGTLSDLKAFENKLTSTEAALTRQAATAHEKNVLGIEAENAASLGLLQKQKDAIVAQRAYLKGETGRIRTQRTAVRGAVATALSQLDIRGATLAASAAFLAGAAAATLFVKAVKSFADLQTELNVFQATTGATADEMQQVAETARALGADLSLPGVSASDAAQAMTELARAGLSVRDAMAGARGVLQLAAAAQISFADAAELTSSALNAFGLSGEDAVHVADLLANAANAAQGSISEMGAALAQASAIARQVGLNLTDTVAILTQFARNGLRGSDAGTSLRTALSRLIAPTKRASDLIDALGIKTRDAQGNLRPDVFVQFGEATRNLSPELRDMIAETIAGQDAIRAFSIGAREGARGLKLAQLQMEATGSAAKLAAARSKGLAGQFSALASNTETLGSKLGKFASGPVAATVTGLNSIVTALNQVFSGDFSGGFLNERGWRQAEANFKQRARGLKDIFTNLPGSPGANKGLGEFFGFAPNVDKEQQRINVLIATLDRLQNLRVNAFQVGANIAPITAQIQRIRKELHDAQVDAGLIIPVTKLEKQLFPLRQARKEAADLRKEILSTGGSPTRVKFLDDLIHNFDVRIKVAQQVARRNAKKLKDDVEKELSGLDIAKSFEAQFKLIAGNIDLLTPDVLTGLNNLARKIKGAAPVTGAAGQEIGKRLIESINKSIQAAVENDDPDTAAQLKKLAEKIAALFGIELGNAFKGIKVPLTDQQLEDILRPASIAVARAAAFGDIDAQIAAHQKRLAELNKRLKGVIKGSAQEEEILNDISSEQDAIRSLREQKAQDAKDANQKSAKKITDAMGAEEQRLLNKLTLAQADESLKNDIRAQIALRNFYTRQIAVAKATIRDAETQRDTVNAYEQKLFDINNDIAENRIARRKQLAQPIEDAAERAAETETLKDDVKQASRRVVFWKNQVKVLKNLVKQRKATAAELAAAQRELDNAQDEFAAKRRAAREQRRDQREQSLQLDIEFFQTTGNTSAEISARRRFIAFLEGQKKFYKGNTIKLKEIRNEIASQNKAIKDLLGESEKGGTTLADLFTQQVAIAKKAGLDVPAQVPGDVTQPIEDEVNRRLRARAAAANLATTVRNQAVGTVSAVSKKPLVTVDDVLDPAIFTALQRLGIQVKTLPQQAKTSTTGPSALVDTPAQQIDKSTTRQVQSNNELIAALNRLTQAVSGRAVAAGGNRAQPSSVDTSTPGGIAAARYNAMARFWRAHKNRNLHEETAGA